MDPAVAAFSPDYATARARFRARAAARGFHHEAHALDATGPRGADLTIDVARLGSDRPRRAVVISSGLHGVEGFLGAAVQLALLGSDPEVWTPPDDSALILLHGLDPFGFAWLRRFDERNVDLNRNFLRPGEAYRGAPALYARLDPVLNPRHAPRLTDALLPRALLAIARHGLTDLRQAIAGGQYDFPRGLFFGGHEPSRAALVLAARLPGLLGDATAVIHLDIHTGLGPWAGCKLLLEPAVTVEQVAAIETWFGAENVVSGPSRGFDYQARGSLGLWCPSRCATSAYSYLCAEFGTYSSTHVLAALRAENQAHHWGRPDARATRHAKERLREAFAPANPAWRASTVRQGVNLARRACAILFERSETRSPAPVNPD